MTSATLRSATGNPATASNLNSTSHRRPHVTAAEMERYAMYNGSIHTAHVHANERRHDLLAEAAHARRVNEAVAANRVGGPTGALVRSAGNLRHHIGVALVRVGHRLQHSAAQPATDRPGRPHPAGVPGTAPGAPVGTLRTAR